MYWLILLNFMFTNHTEDANSQADNKDLKNIRKNIQFCKKKCSIYFLSLGQNKKKYQKLQLLDWRDQPIG